MKVPLKQTIPSVISHSSDPCTLPLLACPNPAIRPPNIAHLLPVQPLPLVSNTFIHFLIRLLLVSIRSPRGPVLHPTPSHTVTIAPNYPQFTLANDITSRPQYKPFRWSTMLSFVLVPIECVCPSKPACPGRSGL